MLQVSATLEKQVRAKEKELIAFQEKYKIRLKVSRSLRYKATSSNLLFPVEPSLPATTCRGKGTKKRGPLISHLPAKTNKEVLGFWFRNSSLEIQQATDVFSLSSK